MRGLSYLRTKLLRRARRSYNSGKFNASARQTRLIFTLFRDRESLDILARSYIRKKRFRKATKCYRIAASKGFSLLDHQDNHFKSELGAENYTEAFRILQSVKGKRNKNAGISDLVRKISKLTDTERVQVIEEMNEISNLPQDISRLLPWSPKVVEYEESEDNYTNLNSKAVTSERYRREIQRIRSSGAFRVSKHISESIRSPKKLIFLPFTLPRLVLRVISQRRGKSSETDSNRYVVPITESRRDCIVFFPTNGVGFGHFTRLLSVAKSVRKISPETEIVFFTTMPTLHILSEEGMICYHMPGRYRYGDMEASQWNALCEEMLSLVIELHRPKAFIFDGAFPYRGMLNSIKSHKQDLFKVWLRRGAIKSGSKGIPVDSISHFNAIIRPGDSVEDEFSEENKNNIPIFRTKPIILESESSDESRLRGRMGIPREAVACYIQLGAGQINDIDSELNIVLDALSKHSECYAIIGESMLGSRFSFNNERVRVLRDYPNSRYFEEFDFAIIAGGYNSFHEVIDSSLPAICFPNLSTGRDDQYARAKAAGDKGAMLVVRSRSRASVGVAISRMMDEETRIRMKNRISSMKIENGSSEAAKWIMSQIGR